MVFAHHSLSDQIYPHQHEQVVSPAELALVCERAVSSLDRDNDYLSHIVDTEQLFRTAYAAREGVVSLQQPPPKLPHRPTITDFDDKQKMRPVSFEDAPTGEVAPLVDKPDADSRQEQAFYLGQLEVHSALETFEGTELCQQLAAVRESAEDHLPHFTPLQRMVVGVAVAKLARGDAHAFDVLRYTIDTPPQRLRRRIAWPIGIILVATKLALRL